jgi:hypothetical protein
MVKRTPRVKPPVADPIATVPAVVPAPVDEPAPVAPAASPAEQSAVSAAGAWPDASSPPAGPHCPWCSAALPATDLAVCPACGAQLNSATSDGEVPGVTTIDVKALAWKAGAPRRNKILSWISGEGDDEPDLSGASASAIEPPSLAVRREMLRLELAAEGITLPDDLGDDPAPDPAPAPATEPEPPGT